MVTEVLARNRGRARREPHRCAAGGQVGLPKGSCRTRGSAGTRATDRIRMVAQTVKLGERKRGCGLRHRPAHGVVWDSDVEPASRSVWLDGSGVTAARRGTLPQSQSILAPRRLPATATHTARLKSPLCPRLNPNPVRRKRRLTAGLSGCCMAICGGLYCSWPRR